MRKISQKRGHRRTGQCHLIPQPVALRFWSIPHPTYPFYSIPFLSSLLLRFRFVSLSHSRYNGQTHNKEGKRGPRTRYVGRLTMEHT